MGTGAEPARVVAEVLRLASSPESRWAAKGAVLSAEELGLAWAIVQAFLEQGGPPGPAWIRATAHDLGLEPTTALAALEAHDLLVLDAASGAIAAAYPFSGVPTAHRVAVAGAQPVYANCAIDALGIPFMLGRDAAVWSIDPMNGESIHVDVRGGEARWTPATSVVLCPAPDSVKTNGPALVSRCPPINFFATPESAAAYRDAHAGRSWQLLAAAEAVKMGRTIFGAACERPPDGDENACSDACCQP